MPPSGVFYKKLDQCALSETGVTGVSAFAGQSGDGISQGRVSGPGVVLEAPTLIDLHCYPAP